MRPQAIQKDESRHYRCRARELGYDCKQSRVSVDTIDNQVVTVLMNLKPPKDWREGITIAMSEMLGEKNLEERIAEIKAIIERMDKRWDHGFVAMKKITSNNV